MICSKQHDNSFPPTTGSILTMEPASGSYGNHPYCFYFCCNSYHYHAIIFNTIIETIAVSLTFTMATAISDYSNNQIAGLAAAKSLLNEDRFLSAVRAMVSASAFLVDSI